MADYSLKNPPILLERRDKIRFEIQPPEKKGDKTPPKVKVYKYTVEGDHLSYSGDNLTIFQALGIHGRHQAILRKAYTYNLYGGNWPECRSEDFPALTRAVWLLFYEQTKANEMKSASFLINPIVELESLRILRETKHLQPILDEVTETFCRVRGYNFRELL